MTGNAAVTALEQLVEKARPSECPALVGELERLKAMAWTKMMQGPGATVSPPAPVQQNGHYLTVQQVCERFNVTPKWLYRHKNQMPHSQPTRKTLLFPEAAITKWFASQKGA